MLWSGLRIKDQCKIPLPRLRDRNDMHFHSKVNFCPDYLINIFKPQQWVSLVV